MLEKDIVKAISKYLKTVPHCWFFKEHGGIYGAAGVPDLICCINGRFVAFEVKTASGRLTKLQESTLRRIKEAKGIACKVTSLQEVMEIIQNLTSETEITSYE